MIYIKVSNFERYLRANRLQIMGSIDISGSVKGMNKHFGWHRYNKIKSGKYIYAVK